MKASKDTFVACLLVGALLVSTASATVNMEMVPVGNPGNPGERSGDVVNENGFQRMGTARLCGAVGYMYKVGKFEVTSGQYAEFLNAVASTQDTYRLYSPGMWDGGEFKCGIRWEGTPNGVVYTAAPGYENVPVNSVSWCDAARFCNWLTNGQPRGGQDLSTTESGSYYLNGAQNHEDLRAVTRQPGARYVIPNEDEWYKAAYYKGGSTNAGYWDYPTSSDSAPSHNSANYWMAHEPNPQPAFAHYTYQGRDCLYGVVGAFENSASPYGTFDQGGNVTEWTETVIDGTYRMTRGGGLEYHNPSPAWIGYAEDMWAMNREMYGLPGVNYESYLVGFRIAEVPEPGSAALLGLGALAVLRRRFIR